MALLWVALVPWLALLDRVRSARGALAAGLAMCAPFTVAVFAWFADAIADYTGAPHSLALALLVVLSPVLEPQLLTFAVARHAARRGGGFWRATLAGASVYVGTEWAAGKLFGDTLGHGLFASRLLRQAADLAGAPGLTFVLVVANECVLATLVALRRGRSRAAVGPAAAVVALVAALLAYGAARVREVAPAGPPLTAAVVQANLSHYDRLAAEVGRYRAVRRILDTHFALSRAALDRGGVDLVVWPETVYPTTFGTPKSEAGADFDREIDAFVARARVPLVFGAYEADGGQEFNAAVFLPPSRDGGRPFDSYRKASLFPLTERVPAWLDSDVVRRSLPWLGTWKPGPGARLVTVALADGRAVRVAPLICYDAVDPRLAVAAVRQGAELIVTLSNDSWFAHGRGPRLHLVMSAFRSLETRRPQLRATNTGISAVITPAGDIVALAAVDERRTLVASVTPADGPQTLVVRWGDWLGPVALALAALLLALPALRRVGPPPGPPCM